MAQFEPGIVLQATANQPQFDPIKNYLVMAQLRAAKQNEQINQYKLAELQRGQQMEGKFQNAAQAAVIPQQGSYQQPAMDLGGNQLPARQMNVQGPAQFNQNAYASNVEKFDPLAANQIRIQQSQTQQAQQQAQQEQLMKMSAQQRTKAQADLEDSAKRYYPILSLPPEAKGPAWKQVNQALLNDGVIHPQQIGTELPAEYPGDQWLAAKLHSAGGTADMLKQLNEQQNSIPLSPDQAAAAGKPVGTRLPVGTVNTIDQIVNRGNENPEAQSQKAWLAQNPHKNAWDYTKAKAALSKGASGGDTILPGDSTTDPNSGSILKQTGLSYPAFAVLTGSASSLPRDKATRAAAMKEAQTWANKHGVDVSTMASQYKANNEVLSSNISRMANTKIMENELEGTIQNLQQVANDKDLGSLKFANVAKIWAGQEVNDSLAQQYAMHLYQLRNELAAYGAATQGRTGNNVNINDIQEAERTIKNGVASGSLTGLETAVKNSTQKMGTVMNRSVDAARKSVWDLFGVGANYKGQGQTGPATKAVDPLGIR